MSKNFTPLPCELAVKAIIPALRAMLAKELTQTYTMKQQDIASALGLTQSAVSQYLRSVRGRAIDLYSVQGVDKIVKEMSTTILNDRISPASINRMYCEACRLVRETRLLCTLHKKVDPDFNVEGCVSCLPVSYRC